jgi:hypothetical protein
MMLDNQLVKKLKKIKPASVILIVDWDDAGGNNTDGWHSIDEFEETNHRYRIRSAGIVVRCTDTYLYLASDYQKEDGHFHSINSIPIGCITKLQFVKM